jgi:DNA-binding transcriptional LysR family regulator
LSAASARIKNLEDNMGVKLIYRHNQGVTLTPQGDTLLHHAGLMLQQSDSLYGDLQEYCLGTKGHVRVFASYNAASEFLPDVIRRFLNKNPRVSVDLQEHISCNVIQAVRNGVTDIGIASSGVHTAGLEVLPYVRDDIVIATSPQHPLASRQIIAFEDSLDYEFVGIPGARWVDTLLTGSRAGDNKRMRIRVQAGSYESACRLVAADIGVCVLPESAAIRNARNSEVKVIKLSNEWAVCNLQIYARNFEQLPRFSRELVDMMTGDYHQAHRRNNMRLA